MVPKYLTEGLCSIITHVRRSLARDFAIIFSLSFPNDLIHLYPLIIKNLILWPEHLKSKLLSPSPLATASDDYPGSSSLLQQPTALIPFGLTPTHCIFHSAVNVLSEM